MIIWCVKQICCISFTPKKPLEKANPFQECLSHVTWSARKHLNPPKMSTLTKLTHGKIRSEVLKNERSSRDSYGSRKQPSQKNHEPNKLTTNQIWIKHAIDPLSKTSLIIKPPPSLLFKGSPFPHIAFLGLSNVRASSRRSTRRGVSSPPWSSANSKSSKSSATRAPLGCPVSNNLPRRFGRLFGSEAGRKW